MNDTFDISFLLHKHIRYRPICWFVTRSGQIYKSVRQFSAFTLVETLVTMLAAGILLLVVMEGVTLFFRLQTQQTIRLLVAVSEREGYYRTAQLLAVADSVTADGFEHTDRDRPLRIWQNGQATVLCLRDSLLIYRKAHFCDTLLHSAETLRMAGADTVEVRFRTGFTAKFSAASSARKQYRRTIREIESGYEYEEE